MPFGNCAGVRRAPDGARPCGAPSCSVTRGTLRNHAISFLVIATAMTREPNRLRSIRLSSRLQDSARRKGNVRGRRYWEANVDERAGGVPKSMEDWERKFAESESDCVPTLHRLQEITPPAGLNAISVFTNESRDLSGDDLYLFDRNELKFYYRDWRLLYYGEEILWREPARMRLSFARIIAQKVP